MPPVVPTARSPRRRCPGRRRLADAHEDDPLHRPQAASECDLADDLGAAELAHAEPPQPVLQNTQPTAQPICVETQRPSRATARPLPSCRRKVDAAGRAPSAPGWDGVQHGQALARPRAPAMPAQRARQEVVDRRRPASANRVRRGRSTCSCGPAARRDAQAPARARDLDRRHARCGRATSARRSDSKNRSDAALAERLLAPPRSVIAASTGIKGRPVDRARTCAMQACLR